MSRWIVPILAVLATVHAAPTRAGEVAPLPASGHAKFQVAYVQWTSRDLSMGDQAGFGTFEFGGITRNLDGKPWFDRMTERCTGQYYWGGKDGLPTNGSCLYVDADGDEVIVNWTGTEPYDGTKLIVGGTGKYAGITGKGTFDGTQLKTAAEGMDYFLTDVDLDFQIKPPSQ